MPSLETEETRCGVVALAEKRKQLVECNFVSRNFGLWKIVGFLPFFLSLDLHVLTL